MQTEMIKQTGKCWSKGDLSLLSAGVTTDCLVAIQ